MRRVSDEARLTKRCMVNMTEEQYQIVLDEANERGLAPSIVARMAFEAGLADIRKNRQAVKRQTIYAKRKAKEKTAIHEQVGARTGKRAHTSQNSL